MWRNGKLLLCAPCCNNCPEVSVDADGMVVITDDNEAGNIRTVKLTKDQFRVMLKEGPKILKRK